MTRNARRAAAEGSGTWVKTRTKSMFMVAGRGIPHGGAMGFEGERPFDAAQGRGDF